MIITFITFFAILNGLRGSDRISKYLCATCMGIIVAGYDFMLYGIAAQSALIYYAVFLGMWVALAPETGKYFGIFNGDLKSYNEVGCKIIDDITDKIIDRKKYRKWCFIAFTIRGAIFYPPFLLMAYFHPISLIYGLGVLLMGGAYFIGGFAPKSDMVRFSEISYAALLGYLFYMSITW